MHEYMSKNAITLIVGEQQHNHRLDVAITELLVEKQSRSQIQKWIKQGLVIVNGKIETKRVPVVAGDVIQIQKEEVALSKKYMLSDINFLYETKEYSIISKPSGLIVHPAPATKGETLVDFLLDRYPDMRNIGEDPTRPGIVHRLDKDASGIMIVARTQNSFDHLKNQFKLHKVKKEYLIVVHGNVTPRQGIINASLIRSRNTGLFVAHKSGRAARTQYYVERSSKKYSLVRVAPESGRTHQIRVHFFSRGFPLVGDKLYKREKEMPSFRLMLHASFLGFYDLLGEYHEYKSGPDQEFLDIVDTLMPS